MKVNTLLKMGVLSASILTSVEAGEYIAMLDTEDNKQQSNYEIY